MNGNKQRLNLAKLSRKAVDSLFFTQLETNRSPKVVRHRRLLARLDRSSRQFARFVVETLGSTIFDSLVGLEFVDLRQNKLTSLPPPIFTGPHSLRVYLKSNKLESLVDDLFAVAYRLERLLIEFNRFSVQYLFDMNRFLI